MGRAEQRKAERRNRLFERKGKRLVTNKEITDMKKTARDKSSEFTVEALMTCFALAEHRLYGFGNVRLMRTLKYIDDLMGDVMSGEITIDDYKQQLIDETGIKIKVDGKD